MPLLIIVSNIGQPGARKLTLDIQAPLLGVGRLVVNRHSGLDREGGCGGGRRSRTGGVRERAAVNTQVCQEALAQANVEFRIAEFKAIVIEHPIPRPNGGQSVAKGVPSDAQARRDRAIKLFTHLAPEGGLGSNESVKVRRIGKDEPI